jgi:SAM-dependent methyltransferase
MRNAFVRRVLSSLIEGHTIDTGDSVLAVCAGPAEGELFRGLGFDRVTLSGIAPPSESGNAFGFDVQDAENLTYEDSRFDWVFVSDGLHHCASPHRGLLEMIRVARRGVLVFESRDSLLARIALRLGLTAEYEIEAVVANGCSGGGIRDTEIPNHVYRWTERELLKTLRSGDPTGRHGVRFFHGLELPYERIAMGGGPLRRVALRLAAPIVRLGVTIFRRQGNCFGMLALKPRRPDDLWPWLESVDGELRFRRSYASTRFRGR